MFKQTLIVAATITSLSAVPASAMSTQHKQELTALGTLAVATAAGGPAGFMLGVLGGSWLVEQVGEAGEREQSVRELSLAREQLGQAEAEAVRMRAQIAALEHEQARFAQTALEQLELEMLFKTGHSSLSKDGRKRIEMLAEFLAKNPDLDIQIEGFTDPRGTEEENLRLSKARAEAVAAALTKSGISQGRLKLVAHGEAQSRAPQGDADAYALERRVRIGLQRRQDGRQVADVTLN